MATTAQPAQQRRPSITQRLSSLIPGRRASQGQSGAQPPLSKEKQKEKERAEFEGGEGLERTVSPLEEGE